MSETRTHEAHDPHAIHARQLVAPHAGDEDYLPALRNAIRLWADAATSAASGRRRDLLRDKERAVASFFRFIGKHPAQVCAEDVKRWQAEMERGDASARAGADKEGRGGKRALKPASVYVRTSHLSSFYAWLMRHPALGAHISSNPASLARPKAPRAYQTEAVKSWTDDELRRLIGVVRAEAAAGEVVGKRDLALLLLYMATGMRREEIICLRGRDIRIDDETLVITGRVKGGDYRGREVDDPEVRAAVLDYLRAAGRSSALKTDAPVWTRHDPAGKPGAGLTSHAFAKRLKRYGAAAGLGHVHLHQTRHTYARIVAEDTGSITDVQDALDHKNPQTTRVYVQRISVKRDKHSRRISERYRPA